MDMDPPQKHGSSIAEYSFVCAICGREAGSVQLFGSLRDAEIVRLGFTSRLTVRVPAGAFDHVRSAIVAGDVRALHDFDLEVASFFCPPCDSCYCGDHWVQWDVFDDDDGFIWHDSIRGRCPHGHERL